MENQEYFQRFKSLINLTKILQNTLLHVPKYFLYTSTFFISVILFIFLILCCNNPTLADDHADVDVIKNVSYTATAINLFLNNKNNSEDNNGKNIYNVDGSKEKFKIYNYNGTLVVNDLHVYSFNDDTAAVGDVHNDNVDILNSDNDDDDKIKSSRSRRIRTIQHFTNVNSYIESTKHIVSQKDYIDKFTLQLMKTLLFPKKLNFTKFEASSCEITNYTYFVYVLPDDTAQECNFERFSTKHRRFENCRIDAYETKSDINNAHACHSNKCTIKFSSKIAVGDKKTNGWKFGGRLGFSAKGRGGINLGIITEAELGGNIEFSLEYNKQDESSKTTEQMFESTIDLTQNQIGIPTIVSAGITCDVTYQNFRYKTFTHNGLARKIVETSSNLQPCTNPPHTQWLANFFDEFYVKTKFGNSLPDGIIPFITNTVTIPLYDYDKKLITLPYIHVFNVEKTV